MPYHNRHPVVKRREFLLTIAQWAFIPFGVSLLEACGRGTGYRNALGGNATQGGSCISLGTLTGIQVVHTPNHTLTIPAVDVIAGATKTYTLSDNGSGHTHDVIFTAADFAMLQNNYGVQEVSTLSAGHTHQVTVICA